jgi:hypothetical protein
MNSPSEISNIIFKAPFTALLAGPSQSGKTTLLTQILKHAHELISPKPTRIVYCYSRAIDSLRRQFKNIEFIHGLPDVEMFDPRENNLLILDDLMTESEASKAIVNLFTVDSHHKNISTFLLAQNLFSKGKYSRTISLNCNYLIVFNNPRDRSQIQFLARQMYPNNPQFLNECYIDATKNKYGYLFIDLHQTTNENYRIQTDILNKRIIYQQK